MSKQTPKQPRFINEIYYLVRDYENVVDDLFSNNVKVYYDADRWSKRDYVVNATVRRGKWTKEDTDELRRRMRQVGATNIIGCVRHAIARDYIDWAFDIKEKKLKELMEDE